MEHKEPLARQRGSEEKAWHRRGDGRPDSGVNHGKQGRTPRGLGKDLSGPPGSAMQGCKARLCLRDAVTSEDNADLHIYDNDFTAVTGSLLEEGAPFSNLHEDASWAAGSLEDLKGSTLSHMWRTLDCVLRHWVTLEGLKTGK